MQKAALAIVLVVVSLAAIATFAQAHFNLTANVPFSFTVDGRQYSAGSYEVRTINPDGLVLRNTKTGQAAIIAIVGRTDPNPGTRSATPQLSFYVAGSQGHLLSITDPEGHNWRVPASKSVLQASRKPESQKVMVALK